MTMADRIVVLRAGRLEQAGPPLSLYDRPANAFVAGFIGSPAMNLIPAELHGGALHLAPGLSVASASRHAGRVTWGIRPEHLALTAEGPGAIPAEVVSVEATGHSTFITASAGALRLTALLTTRPELARGSEIHLKPDPERHHYFDPDTGVRL
jgi:multiple sugar transport system ATP-binding protein